MNNLALSDYIDLDDSQAKKKSVITMLVTLVILVIIYQNLIPFIIEKLPLWPAVILTLIVSVLVACVARYFAKTFKVTKKFIKLGKITLTLFLLYVILTLLLETSSKLNIFKLKEWEILQILTYAAMGGIIEEALFRGLLLNVFIELFSNNKYVFIWASLCECLCFSLYHFLNLGHQSLESTIGQVISVFSMGLIWTYLRFASNGIILGIIWHIYQDISPQLLSSNIGVVDIKAAIIYTIILSLFALICIYSYNMRFNKGYVKE